MPWERLATTQPFPTKPPPFGRQGFTEDDLVDFTPEIKAKAASFLEKIAVVADEIVVMAYDRPADRVIDDVAEEMALTAALGKRM